MATQIEKLQPEQLEKLKGFQAKSNDIVVSLGQISVRIREFNNEIKSRMRPEQLKVSSYYMLIAFQL